MGKSTLCKEIIQSIQHCKYFCLDSYKEKLWDKYGFDSISEREQLATIASGLFYDDISASIKSYKYDYIIIDYPISERRLSEIQQRIPNWEHVEKKTIYLKTKDIAGHKKAWIERGHLKDIRHPGHGATHYHNNVGSGYYSTYESDILKTYYPTIGPTLEIDISFYPYSRTVPYKDILNFIKTDYIHSKTSN